MTQRSGAADSPALSAAGAGSMQLAPNFLDRMMGRCQRGITSLALASDLILIVIATSFALVDLAVWMTDPVVDTGRLSMSIALVVPCLGAVATVAVAVRRRHLRPALVALAVASVWLTTVSWIIGTSLPPSFAAVFGLALLASIALRRDSGGAAVLLAAVAAVAVAAEALRPMVGAAGYLLSACAMGFAVAVSVGVYLRWSDWRQVAAAQAARVDERLEIARELHDMVGHHVTAMVVQAQAARHVAGSQPAAAVAALDRIETCGIETLVAMRRMVGGLRTDAPVGPTSTWDDVDRLIADAAAQGQPVQALIDPEVRTAAPTLAASVHRIIAESLTNVRRHGHDVRRVDVEVIGRPDGVAVIVHDDGRVRGASGQDGFGIVGMHERAASLGGSLSAGPAPDGGWVVHAELPIDHRR